jgi:hypothetical protein
LFIVAVLLGGCAGIGGYQGGPAQGGSRVQVGIAERGRTVPLQVGDRLVLALPKAGQPSDIAARFPGSWVLVKHPQALKLVSERASRDGHFELVAWRPGKGPVVVIGPGWCGGGPMVQAAPSIRCPVAAGDAAGNLPSRPGSFMITVQVRT